ncbi:MAG: YraN family protein [Candidatus Omnitrophota bacterium]
MDQRQQTGRQGEEDAAGFLRKKGYKILARNISTPLGEIDIVAREKDVLCFIEVRTRRGFHGSLAALESVDAAKQRRLIRLALWYMKDKKIENRRVRFDVVAVSPDDFSCFCLVRNAFDDPAAARP